MPEVGGSDSQARHGEGQALNVSVITVEDQVARVAERLESEYGDRVPTGVVQQLVDAAYSPMKKAKVTQFVPVLVDRTVREQLRHEQA